MKTDAFAKVVLVVIALMLTLNLLQKAISPRHAAAQRPQHQTGRYQISAWAAQTGPGFHHSGYYVLDTATGEVKSSKAETHIRTE
jgi:hypothetical protein